MKRKRLDESEEDGKEEEKEDIVNVLLFARGW
jgi:hypothetical protein